MNEVTRHETQAGVPGRERRGLAMRPPVDIYEEDNALFVVADMPGVARDGLNVEVDGNLLSIEGEIRIDMPEGITATYAEVQAQRYARRFTLSHEIDTAAIEARLENGVLQLRLPKKEKHRSRRIEIKAA
ncbi:MAG: Hsp20/alpha crystallin family protein [Halomonas sp.]|uniref:Hsp20/alpha crystallin family protein n=1 Tax=Billgrantia tianxiuensis TaxID=2497861 RepID=A0A6I6SLB2_9GAMM|nr:MULTISPECIES: Hsp20/alpha crystallin family protein [Halomonas]MCE8035825.1 Hsp20/alpha crystallin family protein [Halomonas sp. MCCC 1A11057]MDX5434426.1 Hsp20/alpha crystallin family protein [Halomonas sp.]MDX5503964.1 Hsp20/alpha crystallin family protein [Halomonas sp.]QHC48680.1 Hsp20/alpha crystallin family protein [Halomonas tianxiuensis]